MRERAVEEGQPCLVVFQDFKRAFETVDRGLLLQKLKNWYGIDGNLFDWLESFLSDRYQKVRYNKCVSDTLLIDDGVPQGSKLGPLLFLLCINDLPEVLVECSIHLFADDAILYIRGETSDEVVNIVNQELINVWEWLKKNKLCLEVKKTICIVFGKRS